MAADSAIKAILDFYSTLNAAAFPGSVRPDIFLDEAPPTVGTAQPSEPPYVILVDGGEEPSSDNVKHPWAIGTVKTRWRGSFTLKVYYIDLGEADQCIKAILWNGVDPTLKQGLAFCTLALNPPLVSFPFNCIPGQNMRRYAGFMRQNQRVHMVQQEFTRDVYQNPNT